MSSKARGLPSPTSCIASSSARLRMSRATTNHSFVPQGQSDQSRIPVTMETRSPAQAFALVIGATLAVAGIAGFFYNASFGTGDGTDRDAVLGILDVNGWDNVVHLLIGFAGVGAGLATPSTPAPSTSAA